MRALLRATLFAVLVGIMAPGVALCQLPEDDDFDDHFDAPQPKKAVKKPASAKRRFMDSPITWTIGAGVLAVAIPLGVWKTVGHMKGWAENQGRPKEAWDQEPPPPPGTK